MGSCPRDGWFACSPWGGRLGRNFAHHKGNPVDEPLQRVIATFRQPLNRATTILQAVQKLDGYWLDEMDLFAAAKSCPVAVGLADQIKADRVASPLVVFVYSHFLSPCFVFSSLLQFYVIPCRLSSRRVVSLAISSRLLPLRPLQPIYATAANPPRLSLPLLAAWPDSDATPDRPGRLSATGKKDDPATPSRPSTGSDPDLFLWLPLPFFHMTWTPGRGTASECERTQRKYLPGHVPWSAISRLNRPDAQIVSF